MQFWNDVRKAVKPLRVFKPEAECRQILHDLGVPTFPRPAGIPKNYRVKIGDKGGMIYCHPTCHQTRIRVMPGMLHSPYPHQRKPYVIQQKNGKFLDQFGKVVEQATREAHVPLKEFIFRGE